MQHCIAQEIYGTQSMPAWHKFESVSVSRLLGAVTNEVGSTSDIVLIPGRYATLGAVKACSKVTGHAKLHHFWS